MKCILRIGAIFINFIKSQSVNFFYFFIFLYFTDFIENKEITREEKIVKNHIFPKKDV